MSASWSHHEEAREFPGDRDNARNKGRFTQLRKTRHGLDGQYQHVVRTPRERVNQKDRGQRQMEKVHPWCGQPSDRGRLKNRTACIRSILISSHVVHSSLLRYFTTGRGAEYYNIAVSMFVCRSVCLVSDLKSNFNEQSKADTSQLNLPHGTKLKKVEKRKVKNGFVQKYR